MLRRLVSAGLVLVALQLPTGGAAAEAKSSAEATRSGFKVIALITTDADWRAKWNSPKTPHFREPGVMRPGQKAWLLTMFSNARAKDGVAVLNCDLIIRQTDGTTKKQPAQLCYQGPAAQPGMISMTGLEVGFEVSPSDPSGVLEFVIGVTDAHRGVRVPVTVSVKVDAGKSKT